MGGTGERLGHDPAQPLDAGAQRRYIQRSFQAIRALQDVQYPIQVPAQRAQLAHDFAQLVQFISGERNRPFESVAQLPDDPGLRGVTFGFSERPDRPYLVGSQSKP